MPKSPSVPGQSRGKISLSVCYPVGSMHRQNRYNNVGQCSITLNDLEEPIFSHHFARIAEVSDPNERHVHHPRYHIKQKPADDTLIHIKDFRLAL